jgi:hypothetical protein
VKPRRTHNSNKVFVLEDGNEDSDLWTELALTEEGDPVIISVWEPSDDERRRVADGENVALVVWGRMHPPVMVTVTDDPLGKKPEPPPGEGL